VLREQQLVLLLLLRAVAAERHAERVLAAPNPAPRVVDEGRR
jgi:hypothetical protein